MDLVNAMKSRYSYESDISDADGNVTVRHSESSDSGVNSLSSSLSESQMLIHLPKRTRKAHRLKLMTNIVINDIRVSVVGDELQLQENYCNLIELDLARCDFCSWDEVGHYKKMEPVNETQKNFFFDFFEFFEKIQRNEVFKMRSFILFL